MTVVAWLRDLTDTDTSLVRLIRNTLRADVQESDEAPVGIVIVRAVGPGCLRQIRALTDSTRVIVLLAPHARLSVEMKWSLLAARAADVLDWPGEEQLAACVVPRLARWTEIE